MGRLTRDGTAEPASRDQILRHARGQGNINFPPSADHEQDWQPYPFDPYSAICDDHTYIHTVQRWISPRYYTVDPMLLPSGNPFKCHEEVLSLQPMIPPKHFNIFPSDWGMLRRSSCVQFFFKHSHQSGFYLSDVVTGLFREPVLPGLRVTYSIVTGRRN